MRVKQTSFLHISTAFVLMFVSIPALAQPTISSFTPAFGPTGTAGSISGTTTPAVITITGTGFSTTAANNIVFFGAVYRAATTVSGTTQLTVTAPAGATCQYLNVVNTETGLTGYAYNQNPFLPGFYNEGSMLFSTGTDFLYSPSSGFAFPYFKVADIDGDGKPDLIYQPADASRSLIILRNTSNTGALSFDAAHAYTLTIPGAPIHCFAIGDMDGDGKPDIVVNRQEPSGSGPLFIFPNTSSAGSISMGTRFDITPPDMTASFGDDITLTDVDGDGKTDIIVPWVDLHGHYDIAILGNQYTTGGGFQFIQTLIYSTQSTSFVISPKLVCADFDSDNKVDIGVSFTTSQDDSTYLGIFYNRSAPGNPGFISSEIFTLGLGAASPPPAYFICTADLDGDGKPDMASANYGGVNMVTLLNTGAPGLARRVGVTIGAAPWALAIGDLDGDGKPDLAAVASDNKVYIQRNNAITGTIRFGATRTIPSITSPRCIEICDMDGDGLPDIIIMSATSISIQKGTLKKAAYNARPLPF